MSDVSQSGPTLWIDVSRCAQWHGSQAQAPGRDQGDGELGSARIPDFQLVVSFILVGNMPGKGACSRSIDCAAGVSIYMDTQRLSRFRFRHNLFQQYLYHRLDTVRRAHLHEAVGNTLEIFYGQTSDELGALAPQLAWHFEQAGLADRAAACHLQAGKRAALLAAHEDAISHLTRGLALIETLADTPERVGLRFELQLAAVSPISYARGFWSPERNQALERVRQISQHPALVASSRSWTASAALAYFAMWSAEPVQSLTMGGQLLHQAERNQDAQQLQWAHCMVGCAHLLLGRLTPVSYTHLTLPTSDLV